jgi:ribokinase
MSFLVLGNVAIDQSMSTPNWPTPGATVLVGPPASDLGGKGANQALVLARAGTTVSLVATIGDDEAGRWIAGELAAEGLATSQLVIVPKPTDRSLIFVSASGENAIASTSHCSDALLPAHAEAAIGRAPTDTILLTQGGLTAATTAAAFAAATARGLTIVFNPSALRDGFDELTGEADLLVLNQHEAAQLVGDAPPGELVRRLRSRGAGTVVVTLGAAGALALGQEGEIATPAGQGEVVDTTGAGDTFLGTLAAALYEFGLPLEAGMRAASMASAITVSRRGTRGAFPSRAEMAAILRR